MALTARTHNLGLQVARTKEHACQARCKRLLRHEDELFQFVLVAGLSADTNLAERSIRPLVVIRKISGGSRSPEDTKTRMALASLFETWQARGLNPFDECLRLLSQAAAAYDTFTPRVNTYPCPRICQNARNPRQWRRASAAEAAGTARRDGVRVTPCKRQTRASHG